MSHPPKFVGLFESIIAGIGKAASLLNLVLIALIVIDVTLRALFDQTAAWVGELSWHLFAAIFLLGIPYALQRDRHVRVDLFYENFNSAQKRLVNLAGTVLFLLPWAIVLLYYGWLFAAEAWASGEGSPNPNGIPWFFPVKALIPLAAALLLLQGFASGVRACLNAEEVTDRLPENDAL